MDPDLQELLFAWTGREVEESRQAALLGRLRTDAAFRRAALDEVRLLGQLKAVQSAGPRWLALEDGLAPGEVEPAEVPLEDRVLNEPPAPPAPPRRSRRHAVALAAGLLIGGMALGYALRPGGDPGPGAPPAPYYVAVLVKSDGAEWEAADGPAPTEGSPLPVGRLRLSAGRVTMTTFSGVTLSLQGPADLDLTTAEKVFCRRGKLRARVSPGGEGFIALAPGAAVADLGTEFAMNVAADGKVDLMVFEGMAEVSVLNRQGHTLRSELLEGVKAVSVDPEAGRINAVPPVPESFAPAPELVAPAFQPAPSYPDAVRRSRPWGYWRFEALVDGAARNEVPDRPPLRATGPVALAGPPGGNRGVRFGATKAEQSLVMDGAWTPPRGTGYAVESWVLPEEVGPAALVSLTSRPDEPGQKHVMLLELLGRGHHQVHEPCVLRYLDRWPPARTGGVNAYSRRMYVPYRWHHLVARRTPNRLELYVNGELTGTAPTDAGADTAPCRLLVGRLKTGPQPELFETRPFVGRLDELAVYDYPLSPDDIRRHYELGTADGLAR
jgi:hypothetical protein